MALRRCTVLGALLAAILNPLHVDAANILADGITCTLIDALEAANTDAPVGGCPAGSGLDVIDMQADVPLNAIYEIHETSFPSPISYFGPVGLPVVHSPIVIEGNGHIISREASAPLFRFFVVDGSSFTGSGSPDAELVLRNVVLTGGDVNEEGYRFSVFDSDSLKVGGGAIAALLSRLQIIDSYITDNEADGGGALVNLNSVVSVINTEFADNIADQEGGAIFVSSFGSTTVERSRFIDNVAGRAGGACAAVGFSSDQLAFDIVNSSFQSNTARVGGALALLGSSTQGRVINTLFANNHNSDPGLSTDPVFEPGGGAVHVFNASDLEIRNSQILSNQTDREGGGAKVAGSGATITLVDSEVNDNTSSGGTLGDGGGIAVGSGGNLIARGSEIARNNAWDGGGVNARAGTVTLAASRISSNNSANNGGGILVYQHNADIVSSKILDNRAYREGGGIHFSDGTTFTRTLSIRDSTIAGNRFTDAAISNQLEGAGLHITSFADAEITRSTIATNIGQGSVGFNSAGTAIYANSSANVEVTNSTIAGNNGEPSGGGTIFSNNASSVNIVHSTIVGNAQRIGGGIRNLAGVSIESTILADNTATQDDFDNCSEYFAPSDTGINLADDASCDGAVSVVADADLSLQTLGDNGGINETIALGSSSVAVDATGTDCPDVGNIDQRGVPRDGNCDAGAFEAGMTLPLIGFDDGVDLEVYEGSDTEFEVAITIDKSGSNLESGIVEVWPILRGSAAPSWDYLAPENALPLVFDLDTVETQITKVLRFTLNDDQEEEGPEQLDLDFVFAGPALREGGKFVVFIIDDDNIEPTACAVLQAELQETLGDEDPERYRNHGKYVSPVARATSRALKNGEITLECQGCIVNQFARRVPIAEQTICEGSPVLITGSN